MKFRNGVVCLMFFLFAPLAHAFDFDPEALPEVPENFEASILASEPDFIHPSALAFDRHGRLFVGGGPQFRDPDRDTPPDSIWIVIDKNRDGKAENVKTFATGFNSIQGLAFHDGDLWVANQPDVTVVRDKNNDDRADEYVKVFTNLGHLRHGLHGFNWAPDGRLYMSQGNSQAQKGAPMAWRKLMHIDSDKPDHQPLNKVYTPENYERDYIGKWPSTEGGFLRCRDMGKDLEIFARGNRNPWDWTYDAGFNWLATDNDPGPDHDRVIMPFEGAHFGRMHPWSYSWTGKDNPPTVPISGLFKYADGSGVGVVFYDHSHFPKKYQDLFFIGDWTNNSVLTFRPKWDGALMKHKGDLNNFASAGRYEGGGGTAFAGNEDTPLFRPTDLAVGPGGALFVAGWGPYYGSKYAPRRSEDSEAEKNWGRVFRIRHSKRSLTARKEWHSAKRDKPYGKWTVEQLVEDLGKQLPVWRTNAQEELVRRGEEVVDELRSAVRSGELKKMAETWAVWTLGRIGPDAELFSSWASGEGKASFNVRRQAIRILGDRGIREASDTVAEQLTDSNPRIRFSATQALRHMEAEEKAGAIAGAAAEESDRLCFYVQWKALRAMWPTKKLKRVLHNDDRENVRRAALLALLEDGKLGYGDVVRVRAKDSSERVTEVAKLWLKKTDLPGHLRLSIGPARNLFRHAIEVRIQRKKKQGTSLRIRYTTDGSMPDANDPVYNEPITLSETSTVKAALFDGGNMVGTVHSRTYRKISDRRWETNLFVYGLKVNSDRDYRVARHGLKEEAPLYTDRHNDIYKRVPDRLRGATYIRTPNDDAGVEGKEHLQFHVNQPSTVYVAYDARENRPSWMGEAYERTDLTFETTEVTFRLYRRDVEPGKVTLGGNGGAESMYQVVVVRRTGDGSRKAGIAEAMSKLDEADPERGRKLFFSRGTCMGCHKLEGKGNEIGPDLSDVGTKRDLRYIVRSIVKPSAEIIEGYHQESVRTIDGNQYFGMIRAESKKTITLFTIAGQQEVTIPKDEIQSRKKLNQSAMPASLSLILDPGEVADIAVYLNRKKGD